MSDGRETHQSGRTLHLIDLNSLVGPRQRIEEVRWAVSAYRSAAGIRPGDHAVLRAGIAVTEVTRIWPGCHLVTHCACVEQERVADAAAWCATRYDRVVVGSGDVGFVPFVEALRLLRVALLVVAPPDKVSRELAEQAGRIVALRRPPEVRSSLLGRGW